MNLRQLNYGYVLERTVSPKGAHMKWKIINPKLYIKCDNCSGSLGDKAVRFEGTGNRIITTLCLDCYRIEKESRRVLH